MSDSDEDSEDSDSEDEIELERQEEIFQLQERKREIEMSLIQVYKELIAREPESRGMFKNITKLKKHKQMENNNHDKFR